MKIAFGFLLVLSLAGCGGSGSDSCNGEATVGVDNSGNVEQDIYLDGSYQGHVSPGGRFVFYPPPGAHDFFTVQTTGIVGDYACLPRTVELYACRGWSIDCGVHVY